MPNKIKSDQLDLDEIYASHALSAVYAENGGGGGSTITGTSVPPLAYISMEISASQVSSGIVDFGQSFYWPTKTSERGKFLEVYLNGQRLTYGVEYIEEPYTIPPGYQNINRIHFAGSSEAASALQPITLVEHDVLVAVIPTVLSYDNDYIAQTSHYVHGAPWPAGNVIGGAYSTFTASAGGTNFFISTYGYDTVAGPPSNLQSTGYQYITGGNATGRSLSVYLNGVRLYNGIDYDEMPLNNATMVRSNYIRLRPFYTIEVDDHLFFQTVNPGYLDATLAASASYASYAASAGSGGSGDGSGVIAGQAPVGVISYFGGANPPTDWLVCDGAEVSKATYSKLYAIIGDTFNSRLGVHTPPNNPTLNFRLPYLIGEFIRGSGATRGAPGTYQFGSIPSHDHGTTSIEGGMGGVGYAAGGYQYNLGAGETRPANLALLPCIKVLGNVELVTLTTGNPLGSVVSLATTAIPAGYVPCSGQYLDKVGQYAQLYSVIGDTYGTIGGTFRIPDYRGMFHRGYSFGVSGINYPDETGRTLSQIQDDAFQSHKHDLPMSNGNNIGTVGIFQTSNVTNLTEPDTGLAGLSSETRPVNMAVVYAMKAIETDYAVTYATSADVLDGMHWSDSTSATGIKQYIDDKLAASTPTTTYGVITPSTYTAGLDFGTCVYTKGVTAVNRKYIVTVTFNVVRTTLTTYIFDIDMNNVNFGQLYNIDYKDNSGDSPTMTLSGQFYFSGAGLISDVVSLTCNQNLTVYSGVITMLEVI